MKDDYVLEALRALAETDRDQEASPETEARLLRAFHSRRSRGRGWAAWAILAATAAGLAITALWWTNQPPQPSITVVSPVSRVPEAARLFSEAEPTPRVEPTPRIELAPLKVAPKLATVRQPERQLDRQPEPREVVTDFFPLMNPEPAFERGQMLRVQLPAAAMQRVGLPVREEHLGDLVQADVLVGEEGLPRAIRFVRFDVK